MAWGSKKIMSFAELQQAILDEAKKQADAVEGKYRQELNREEERIKTRVAKMEEEIIAAAESEGERQYRRLHQEAQLMARAEILRAKQRELKQTAQETAQEILAWGEEESTELIKKLMASVPKEKGTITAGEKHEPIIKKEAEKRGLKMTSATVADDGGFVYRSKKIELNLLVNHLVEGLFGRNRAVIAKELFS